MKEKYLITPISISSENLNDGCFYCQRFDAEFWDHIVPKHLDGKDTIENLIPCCMRCNSSKGKKSLHQWRKDIIKYRHGIKFETPDPYPIKGKRYLSLSGGFIKFISDNKQLIIEDFREYIGHISKAIQNDEYSWIQATTRILNKAQ